MNYLTDRIRRVRRAIRAWYAARSDAFKAAMVAAWVTAMARAGVPILTLADDVQNWIAGTGPAVGVDQLVTVGRTTAAAGYGVVAAAINYRFRRYRPNVTYTTNTEDPAS